MNCLRLLPITLAVGLAFTIVLPTRAQDNPITVTNLVPELQFAGNEPAVTDVNRQTLELPNPPTGLSATTFGDHAVRLSWTPDPAGQREYEIERALSGFGFSGTWETSSRIGGGVTSCVDPDRIPGAIRSYRVRTWNPAGYSAYSEIVTANTPSPCREIVLAFGYAPEMPVQELTNVTALAVGSYHALALRADGTVVGWGDDGYQQASPPTNLNHVIAIATRYYHSLALRSDGTVVGWGADWDGQVSGATDLTNIKAIAAGGNHSLALRNDGTVVGWGYDGEGSATPPTNLTGVVAIAAGGAHSLALKSDGTVVGWGADWDGQSTPPTNLTGVAAISTGYYLSMALRNNGEVVAWGYWSGDKDELAGLSGRTTAIAAGYDFSLILTYTVSPPEFGNHILQAANRVHINWNDRSANEYGFRIQRRSAYDLNPPAGWTDLGTVPANITNFTDITTVSNGYYLYRVQSLNPGCGNSPFSSYMYVSVVPPNSLYYLWTAVGETNVSVSWYLDYAATGYRLERAPDVNGQPGLWTQLAVIAGSALQPETGIGTFTETNVVIGASYWYRVQAFNAVGDSAFSPSARLDVLPPSVPTLSAYAFADQAILQWYYSSGGMKIERAPDGGGAPGSWQELAVLPAGNEGRYSDPGRILNTISWYRVRAFNFAGNSAYSEPRPVVTLPPRAPTSLYAYMGISNGVDLNWYVEQGDRTGFDIERAPDVAGAPGAWASVGTLTNSNNNTYLYYTDRPVQPFRRYWYRVRGFNTLGQSPYSTPVQVTIIAPAQPDTPYASSFADQINLSWYINSSTIIESVQIQRALDAGGQPGVWTDIATLTGNSYYGYYTDTGRVANVTYWYRVRASNWAGAGPFSPVTSARLAPPGAPQYLNVTLGTTNQALVSWNAGYPNDQDGFKLERAPDINNNPGVWQQIATTFATNYYYNYSEFLDTNVQVNAGYWYRVRAFNRVGHSPYSDRYQFRVQPPATPNLYFVDAFRNTISINWSGDYYYAQPAGFRIERAADNSGLPGTWSLLAILGPERYSYADQSVPSGTTYWYRVRAFSWTGTSAPSTPLSASITGPSAPNSVYAWLSTTSKTAVVSWYTDQGEANGYRIQRAPNAGNQPGAWTDLATVFETNSYYLSHLDTNVVAFATNWYRVSAFNEIGSSTNSLPTQLRVMPPAAPNSLSAGSFRDTVRLYWYHSDPYNTGVIGYKIQRAPNLNGVPGAWTTIATNLTPDYYYSGSFIDTNRLVNNRYWYRVLAYNWVGDSPVSAQVSALIVGPATPTGLSATFGETNGVLLSCYSPVGDQNGFQFEVAPNVGSGPGTWRALATVNNTNTYYTTYYTDTNALPFTTNWYRVRAFSSLGVSAYTTALRVPLAPPSTPSGLTPYGNSFGSVSIYWNSSSGFVQGYKIERASDVAGAPGSWVQIGKTAYGYYTSFSDLAVIPGTTYWYRVRAYNWIGNSAYTAAVRVSYSVNSDPLVGRVSLEPGPATLAVAVEGNDIVLTWQARGGTTNFVQATDDLTESFVDRTGPIVVPGEGPVTLVYRDPEAAVCADRRFYRIRIQP